MRYLETENRMVFVRGCRVEGIGRYCLIGTELLFAMMKRVLEKDGGDSCKTM